MGFNLELTAFSSAPNVEGLRAANLRGRWRVFASPCHRAWLMDFGHGPKQPGPVHWDSSALLATRRLPPVPQLPDLPKEEGELLADLAYGACLLSEAAGAPCFTCLSNDEAVDAVVAARDGEPYLLASVEYRDETIDERSRYERIFAQIFENGDVREELLTELKIVDDGKMMFVEEEGASRYTINGLSDRLLEAFLGFRPPVFEDNILREDQWDWPMIAAHPEQPKGGFLRRLLGR